jgi:hypothetical protein
MYKTTAKMFHAWGNYVKGMEDTVIFTDFLVFKFLPLYSCFQIPEFLLFRMDLSTKCQIYRHSILIHSVRKRYNVVGYSRKAPADGTCTKLLVLSAIS